MFLLAAVLESPKLPCVVWCDEYTIEVDVIVTYSGLKTQMIKRIGYTLTVRLINLPRL